MEGAGCCSSRLLSLICLFFQNAGLVLLMRYSRSRRDRTMFLASTAVMVDELMKFTLCLLMVRLGYPKSAPAPEKTAPGKEPDLPVRPGGFAMYLRQHVVTQNALLMAVPAVLYTVQKNLLYVALSNLDACVYQVTYSAKTLTTAVFSCLILGRKFPPRQQAALLVLMAGVALVEVAHAGEQPRRPTGEHPSLGFAAVGICCCTSGFAAVFFEYWLKQTAEIWTKNLQLSFFGFLLAGMGVAMHDAAAVVQGGFFQGYDSVVVLTIAFQAGGGIIVALVTKYADSIAKNFATALSLTAVTALSAIFWEFEITSTFVLGAALTMGATYLYQNVPPPMSRSLAVRWAVAFAISLTLWLAFTSGKISEHSKRIHAVRRREELSGQSGAFGSGTLAAGAA